MNSPKISVVIPSYNKVKFIGQTLKSIVSQGYPNYEVIIQDGGSTDGTLDIIKEFARKYPEEIKWESGRDRGQLDAIKKGFTKASGNILTYINADDSYQPNAFKLVANPYSINPDSLWFAGRGRIVNTKGKEIAGFTTVYKDILLSINSRFFLLVTNYLMQPSVFINSKAYRRYGPFSGTRDFVMEYDLWLKLSKLQMPVVIDRQLSNFRIEPLTKTKQMAKILLQRDLAVVRKHTHNPLILVLHKLNNFARILVNKFV